MTSLARNRVPRIECPHRIKELNVHPTGGPRLRSDCGLSHFRLPVRSDLANGWDRFLKKPLSAEEAEAEKPNRFAVRANSILAFIECDDEQRPKLREAIVEAMLWAQTQP